MGNCCSNERLHHYSDVLVDNVNQPKQKMVIVKGAMRRAVTENCIGKKLRIKTYNQNAFNDGETALRMIKKHAHKRTQSQTSLFAFLKNKPLKESSVNDIDNNTIIKPTEDLDLSRFVDKNETNDEEEKNVMKLKDNEVTSYDEEKIYEVLMKHILFDDLPEEIIHYIMMQLVQLNLQKGKYIYKEGFRGDFFYIISKGSVSIISQGITIRQYKEWECFGYMSLFCNRQVYRNDSHAKCDTDVTLYILDGESFQSIQRQLLKFRLDEQFEFLHTISIFQNLNNIDRYNIAEKIKKVDFTANETVSIDKTMLLLIRDGSLKWKNSSNVVLSLESNEYYGVDAILLDDNETNTDGDNIDNVTALERTTCYEISKNLLIEALGNSYKEIILMSIFKAFTSQHPFFKDIFNQKNITEIFPMFTVKRYSEGEHISSNKTSSRKLIIIVIEGNFVNEKTKEKVTSRGDILGETVITQDMELDSNIIAFPECIVIQCEVDQIKSHLTIGNHHSLVQKIMKRVNKIKQISIFKYLSENILIQIVESIVTKNYKKQEIIIQEDTPGDSFFLIAKGRIQITKGDVLLREMEKGSCFGETALLQPNNKRTATVKALENVKCYILSKENFDLIVRNPLIKEYLIHKMSLQDITISLNELYFIKPLGKGQSGNVTLVHNMKNTYALKTVSLAQANKNHLQKYLATERALLVLLDHPFIVRMVKTFRNDFFIYFLLEYTNGQPLDEYLLNRFQVKNIEELRFFISCILSMIDYLNKKSLIHRDIKPANIMIDSNGYLKLLDFGTAKMISDYTLTAIGTPQYMAPEILKGKGYSMSCDYWSIGVCAYEIYYGKMPFGQNSNDIISIYQSIINDTPLYSSKAKDKLVNNFIEALLNKQVNKRLCNLFLIKNLKLLEGIDFDQLLDFSIEPPHKPKVKTMNMKHHEELKYVDYEKRIIDSFEISSPVHSPIRKPKESVVDNDYSWADEFI